MPYADDGSDVPKYVTGGDKKRRQWSHVWMSEYKRQKGKGKSDKEAEQIAYASANSVASKAVQIRFEKLLQKATEDEAKAFADALIEEMQKLFETLPGQIRAPLEAATLSGVGQGLIQVDVDSSSMIASANAQAQQYAADRAAELVGMKYDEEGNLVENPNPQWAISDTTREKIRDIVTEAFGEETPLPEIATGIQEALEEEATGNGIFSQARATMIARTEVMRAQVGGNFSVWRDSGVVKKVKWLTSNLQPCEECLSNEGLERDIGKAFPTGAVMPPEHPNCFVGETIFSSFDNVTKYFRRRFHGDVLTFRIATGEYFTVTPNHPVLTKHGWLPARAIKQGMDLLYCADPRASISRVNPHQHLMPTMAQDVPASLSKSGLVSSHSMPVSAKDFHGDGSGNGEVDIVFANRLVKNKRKMLFREMLGKLLFPLRHARRSSFSCQCRAFKSTQRNPTSTDRFVRSVDDMGTLPFGISAPVQNASFADVSDFKPHEFPSSSQRGVMHANQWSELDTGFSGKMPFVKSHDNAIGNVLSLLAPRKFHGRPLVSDRKTFSDKGFANAANRTTDQIGDVLQRLAGLVKLIPVMSVGSLSFSGYVHNLETARGYYTANGVIVHNCACVLVVSKVAE